LDWMILEVFSNLNDSMTGIVSWGWSMVSRDRQVQDARSFPPYPVLWESTAMGTAGKWGSRSNDCLNSTKQTAWQSPQPSRNTCHSLFVLCKYSCGVFLCLFPLSLVPAERCRAAAAGSRALPARPSCCFTATFHLSSPIWFWPFLRDAPAQGCWAL